MRFLGVLACFIFLSILSVQAQDTTKPDNRQRNAASEPRSHPPPSTTVEVNVGSAPEACKGNPAQQSPAQEPKRFMTNGEWIISIITTIYVVIAYFTFRAMRDSSERQLRAYVVSERSSIVNVADPILAAGLNPTDASRKFEWGPIGGIHIINAGQTPAFKVRHWGNICFREYPLRSPLPERSEVSIPSFSVLGPGILSTKTLTLNPRLTDEQVAELRATTAAIYFYGEITYEDAFKKKHSTKYRVFHNACSGNVGLSTDFTFASEGNEAD